MITGSHPTGTNAQSTRPASDSSDRSVAQVLLSPTPPSSGVSEPPIALLTGGSDRPYVFGLVHALTSLGTSIDLIGSDELASADIAECAGVTFLNLRGSLRPDVTPLKKVLRLSRYYARLIRYATTAKPRVFHILWNNKIEWFDRTLLMFYYKLTGRRVVLTAHNVNAGRRDHGDTLVNRLTLAAQYHLADHIFVHTDKMKRELLDDFRVRDKRITIIPFGVNTSVPNTALTPTEARRRLGIGPSERVVLFFGRITPYKGLDCLITAFRQVLHSRDDYRLIIAGRPDNCESYWRQLRESFRQEVKDGRILLRAGFIPDGETEIYFKAADVCALPYKDIYQSGVLFLAQSFGVPAIATDVGSFREDVLEDRTGFLCKPGDAADLARAIETYFCSNLFHQLERTREKIREYVHKRHSWDAVGRMTCGVYANLQKGNSR